MNFSTSILHFNKKGNPGTAFPVNYIFGVLVVSGGVVLEVSFNAVSGVVVVFVVVVESTVVEVLSVDPDTFLVELHAEAASIIEPAKARLRIVFFMMYDD